MPHHATKLQKDPERVNDETMLRDFGPNWAQIALAQKGNFFGKLTSIILV